MTVADYMNLRCLCGLLRREHVHSYADTLLPGDVLNPHPTDLRMIGGSNDCVGFTWELERGARRQPAGEQASPSPHDRGRLMFGKPQDVEGECNACLFVADNYGDDSATIRCQLAPGHDGLHREEFTRKGGPVTITWTVDERRRCDHGCGQWEHDHFSESASCPKDADDHEWSDCAHCHPGETIATCDACDKPHYCESAHKLHCPREPFACADCGESGVGVHACPKIVDGSSSADDFSDGGSP